MIVKKTEEAYENILQRESWVNDMSHFTEAAKQDIYELGIEVQRLDYFVNKCGEDIENSKREFEGKFQQIILNIGEFQESVDTKMACLEQMEKEDIERITKDVSELQSLCNSMNINLKEMEKIISKRFEDVNKDVQKQVDTIRIDTQNKHNYLMDTVNEMHSEFNIKTKKLSIAFGIVGTVLIASNLVSLLFLIL